MKNALISALVALLVATWVAPAGDLKPAPITRPNAQDRIAALIERVDRLQNLEARHHATQAKQILTAEGDSFSAYQLANAAMWATDCLTGAQYVTQDDDGYLVYTDKSDTKSTLVPELDPACAGS